MPEFRPYTSDDLLKVLQFIGECFRDGNFSHHHSGDIVHWMSNGYQGTDLNKYFWLYEERGEITAFAELAKGEWGSYTLITNLEHHEGDKELTLLGECQSIMRKRIEENLSNKRILSTNVATSDQKLEHLKNLGYQIKPSNHVVTLKSFGSPIPTPVLPSDFQIRSVSGENEADLVAAVHNGSFGSSWSPEAYIKVMRTPGFDIARELVVVAPDGRFAAFLVYWLDPISKVGLFEPVGCHKKFQRQGLATALMYEAMKRMMDAGMTNAVVGHNRDNEAAVNLYTSLGFAVHFKTLDCEIDLASEP